MIFLTVGSEFHFDRLVEAVDRLIAESFLSEEVVGQIGYGGYEPQYMNWVPTMPRGLYAEHIRSANRVISHAGMGTIIQCLLMEKPLLVMPRRGSHPKEHVNDHQFGTAEKFEKRGSILVARDTVELSDKINQLIGFYPVIGAQQSRKAMTDRINRFLIDLKRRA
jgi:UDP-N-acetylglucosamine transferase subunit ALG13